ncbi:MAG: hypothetical protein ACLFWG_00360 [Longimicrobiales bacterium]
MTMRWLNEGAPFETEDGRTVPSGGELVAGRRDPDVVRRRHKLRYLGTTEDHDPELSRFAGVDFGSDRAYEVARDSRREADGRVLTWEDFEGLEGSGADGAFLVGDVRDLVRELLGERALP